MPWDQDNEDYKTSTEGRYTPPADTSQGGGGSRKKKRSRPSAAPPVLEAQTARYEVYPNEIAVFHLAGDFSVDNDTETVIIFDTTTGRWAMEQGLERDLTNLDRIYITSTPSEMVYEVEGFVRFAAGATGYRQVAIDSEDGLSYQVLACIMPVTTASIPTVVPFQATLVRQEADTYLTLKVRHTQGAALNIEEAQLHVMRIH